MAASQGEVKFLEIYRWGRERVFLEILLDTVQWRRASVPDNAAYNVVVG